LFGDSGSIFDDIPAVGGGTGATSKTKKKKKKSEKEDDDIFATTSKSDGMFRLLFCHCFIFC